MIRIAALVAKRAVIFLPNTPQFGEPATFSRQKLVHCGTATKVWHFWWEKSNTHAAMFSSAAAVHLLIRFDAYH